MDVLYPPEFQQSQAEFKAGPGDTAKLVCKVKAAPDPDVIWNRKSEDGKVEKIDKKVGGDKKWDRYELMMTDHLTCD